MLRIYIFSWKPRRTNVIQWLRSVHVFLIQHTINQSWILNRNEQLAISAWRNILDIASDFNNQKKMVLKQMYHVFCKTAIVLQSLKNYYRQIMSNFVRCDMEDLFNNDLNPGSKCRRGWNSWDQKMGSDYMAISFDYLDCNPVRISSQCHRGILPCYSSRLHFYSWISILAIRTTLLSFFFG